MPNLRLRDIDCTDLARGTTLDGEASVARELKRSA
jgi:hypothetical protein